LSKRVVAKRQGLEGNVVLRVFVPDALDLVAVYDFDEKLCRL
jgi:hypothetical protein